MDKYDDGYSDRLFAMSEDERFLEMWGIATYQAKMLRVPEEHREETISEVAYHLQMRAWHKFDPGRGIKMAGWLHYVAKHRTITEFKKHMRKSRELYGNDQLWGSIKNSIPCKSNEQDLSWGRFEGIRDLFHPFEQWVLEHLTMQPGSLKLKEPLITWFMVYGVSRAKVEDVRDRLWRVINKGHTERRLGRQHDLDVEWLRLKRRFKDLCNHDEQERARRLDGEEN